VGGERDRFAAAGWPRYRADQWAAWVYARGAADYEAMTDLPAELRRELAGRWPLPVLEVVEVKTSVDGTRKARLVTDDRSNGYFRFLFSKPVSVGRFYLQQWVLHGMGFVVIVGLPVSAADGKVRACGVVTPCRRERA